MFAEKNIPHRKADEKIIIYVHPHWIHLVSAILLFAVLAALPVGIFYVAQSSGLPFLTNQVAFPVLVMLGGLYLLSIILITYNTFLDHVLDVWAVTNYRIISIEQRGLFNRAFAEHLIERIQDVMSVKKGILATFLNFGDVEIQTAGEQERFVFNDVTDPERIVQTINELLSQRIQKPQQPPSPEQL